MSAESRRAADLTLMREHHRWPLVDLLPLERGEERGRIEIDGRGGPFPIVVSGRHGDLTHPRVERRYASFEDIYDDGWRVN